MRTHVARPLMQLLIAGIFSAGSLVSAAAPSVAPDAARGAAPGAQLSATPEPSGSLPGALRGGDRDPVADVWALDFSNTDEMAPFGCEGVPTVFRAAGDRDRRAVSGEPSRSGDSAARVERRFLRYSRLLD